METRLYTHISLGLCLLIAFLLTSSEASQDLEPYVFGPIEIYARLPSPFTKVSRQKRQVDVDEDADPEDVDLQDADPEDADPEDADPEGADPERVEGPERHCLSLASWFRICLSQRPDGRPGFDICPEGDLECAAAEGDDVEPEGEPADPPVLTDTPPHQGGGPNETPAADPAKVDTTTTSTMRTTTRPNPRPQPRTNAPTPQPVEPKPRTQPPPVVTTFIPRGPTVFTQPPVLTPKLTVPTNPPFIPSTRMPVPPTTSVAPVPVGSTPTIPPSHGTPTSKGPIKVSSTASSPPKHPDVTPSAPKRTTSDGSTVIPVEPNTAGGMPESVYLYAIPSALGAIFIICAIGICCYVILGRKKKRKPKRDVETPIKKLPLKLPLPEIDDYPVKISDKDFDPRVVLDVPLPPHSSLAIDNQGYETINYYQKDPKGTGKKIPHEFRKEPLDFKKVPLDSRKVPLDVKKVPLDSKEPSEYKKVPLDKKENVYNPYGTMKAELEKELLKTSKRMSKMSVRSRDSGISNISNTTYDKIAEPY